MRRTEFSLTLDTDEVSGRVHACGSTEGGEEFTIAGWVFAPGLGETSMQNAVNYSAWGGDADMYEGEGTTGNDRESCKRDKRERKNERDRDARERLEAETGVCVRVCEREREKLGLL